MKRWTLIALLMLLVLPTYGAQAAPSVTIAPEAAGVPAAVAGQSAILVEVLIISFDPFKIRHRKHLPM